MSNDFIEGVNIDNRYIRIRIILSQIIRLKAACNKFKCLISTTGDDGNLV